MKRWLFIALVVACGNDFKSDDDSSSAGDGSGGSKAGGSGSTSTGGKGGSAGSTSSGGKGGKGGSAGSMNGTSANGGESGDTSSTGGNGGKGSSGKGGSGGDNTGMTGGSAGKAGAGAESGTGGSVGAGGSGSGDGGGGGKGGTAGAGGSTGGAGGSTGGTGGSTGGAGGSTGGTGGSTGGSAGAGGASTAGGTAGTGAAGAGGGAGSSVGGSGGAGGKSAGCGSENTTSPCGAKGTMCSMDIAGTARTYYVQLPSGYDPATPYRVIFQFHPWGGSADQGLTMYQLSAGLSDSIFVTPQGLDVGGNGAGWANTDGVDIEFTKGMLAEVQGSYCVDNSRIFSVGFSFGGMMSIAVACEMSDVFRAIAPMSGSLYSDPTCKGTGPHIAMWGSHGTSDTVVPIEDGRAARDKVLAQNHCGTTTTPVDPSPCVKYEGCDPGYDVTWCEWNGPHGIPSFGSSAITAFFKQF